MYAIETTLHNEPNYTDITIGQCKTFNNEQSSHHVYIVSYQRPRNDNLNETK